MPYHIKATQAEGRFRGGVKHTKEGRAWADGELNGNQLDVIKRDPVLVVKELSSEEYAALREEEQAAMEEIQAALPASGAGQTTAPLVPRSAKDKKAKK